MINRRAVRKMLCESHESEVPTNTHRAWAELVPMILNQRRMLQRQPCLATLRTDSDVNPTRRFAKFPGRCKMTRRRARGEGAARVPLQLVPSTQREVSLDGQKPSRNALFTGYSFPQILSARVVKPCQRDRAGRFSILLEIAHRVRDEAEYTCG